jgi:carbohydrate diacid regulator
MKEATKRVIGVIDSAGTVIASSDLTVVGANIGVLPQLSDESGEQVVKSRGKTFKILDSAGARFDYAVFAEGEDDFAKTLCIMASIAVSEAKENFDENNDVSAFIKSIITDNILPGDIFVHAKELYFVSDVPRSVIGIRQLDMPDLAAISLLRELFPDKQRDFIIPIGMTDIALVTELPPDGDPTEYVRELAAAVESKLSAELPGQIVIGVGLPARDLRELADRHKEAQVAIEVGRVFDTEKTVIYYENLGIGRLIYQLPTTLCEMFLSEIFKKNPIEALDAETLYTINKFFENDLNVSETSRKLFVHRNTLVYRLEKIKKITGLDLRELDHAIVFKVALMVKKYLNSQGTIN